jgi:hypothetical protein
MEKIKKIIQFILNGIKQIYNDYLKTQLNQFRLGLMDSIKIYEVIRIIQKNEDLKTLFIMNFFLNGVLFLGIFY